MSHIVYISMQTMLMLMDMNVGVIEMCLHFKTSSFTSAFYGDDVKVYLMALESF